MKFGGSDSTYVRAAFVSPGGAGLCALGVLAFFSAVARVASRARVAALRPRTRIGTVRPALQEAVKSGVNG